MVPLPRCQGSIFWYRQGWRRRVGRLGIDLTSWRVGEQLFTLTRPRQSGVALWNDADGRENFPTPAPLCSTVADGREGRFAQASAAHRRGREGAFSMRCGEGKRREDAARRRRLQPDGLLRRPRAAIPPFARAGRRRCHLRRRRAPAERLCGAGRARANSASPPANRRISSAAGAATSASRPGAGGLSLPFRRDLRHQSLGRGGRRLQETPRSTFTAAAIPNSPNPTGRRWWKATCTSKPKPYAYASKRKRRLHVAVESRNSSPGRG